MAATKKAAVKKPAAPKKAKAAPAVEVPEVAPVEKPMIAFKAFDKEMKCRGFQFEIGKTYEHDGPVKLCESGFHACESPMDVWNYYPIDAPVAQVELTGVSDERREDSKVAAKTITIKAALTIPMIVSAQFEWTFSKAKEADKASGYYSKAASSGNYSTAASSGYYSKAASSGNYSTAASSGDSSTAASSGNYSTAASSGYSSKAASSGNSSTAASSGNSSTAASSGDSSTAEAKGEKTIAMVAGCNGRARAGIKGAFALAWYDEANEQMRIAVGVVGEDGIEADTWYRVEAGKLVLA
jgi:hypothetical protein